MHGFCDPCSLTNGAVFQMLSLVRRNIFKQVSSDWSALLMTLPPRFIPYLPFSIFFTPSQHDFHPELRRLPSRWHPCCGGGIPVPQCGGWRGLACVHGGRDTPC